MTENNFKTDLTFFTNEPNVNLLDRFVQTLKDAKIFDAIDLVKQLKTDLS